MYNFSGGRPVDYLAQADYEDLRSDGNFTPGGFWSTIALPLVAELAGEGMLGGPDGITKGKFSILGRAATKKEIATLAKGFDINPTQSAPSARTGAPISSSESARLRGAVNFRTIARGIGMIEIMKMGVDLGEAAVGGIMNYRTQSRRVKLETGPGFFNDTRAAHTQRQRAIQAIHNSQMTTRAALGNEASFLHI